MQADYNAWDKLVAQLQRVKFRAGECDSRKLWELGLVSWKNEMGALVAQGLSPKDLPNVSTPYWPPPMMSGVPNHWQPPHPPWVRARFPVPHNCDDGHPHPDMPVPPGPGQPVPGVVPPGTPMPAPTGALVPPGSAVSFETPAGSPPAAGMMIETAPSGVPAAAVPLHIPTGNAAPPKSNP
jgi:hypothetical protein